MDRQKLAFCALYITASNATPATVKLLRLIQHGTPPQKINAASVLARFLETTAQTNRVWIAQQSRPFFDSILAQPRATYDTGTLWLLSRLARQYGDADCESLLRRLNHHPPSRYWSERYLDPTGCIRNLLHLESTNDAAKVGAAMLFRDSPVMPERVVPLLIKILTSSNRALLERSAQALGSYGAQSKPALPLLTNLSHHPRPAVSRAALSAIDRIENAP